MGYQRDQNFAGVTHRPGSQPSLGTHQPGGAPPPLPPREGPALLSPDSQEPPSYGNAVYGYQHQPLTHSWSGQDPRGQSTESLLPSPTRGDGRRTLLLIYIHGFLGNETSFQSFPAHVHNAVTTKLVDTHVVHTKIYPRYKSRKAIEYARDDFSNWLCPHESPETDIIMLGHSMGGILSAEVALLAPYSDANRERFRHRILGTISFDTPFLGMHPGVIVSGIGSLFKPKPASPTLLPLDAGIAGQALLPMPQSTALLDGTPDDIGQLDPRQSQSTLGSGYFPAQPQLDLLTPSLATPPSSLSPFATPTNDPNYNPPFPNDVRLPMRKGWDSTLHFIMKHSDGLTKATRSYVTSHLEFGGCLADYRGLKLRYEKLRALEDVDDSSPPPPNMYRPPVRIRFVNYYTASTGRIHPPKQPQSPQRARSKLQADGGCSELGQELQDMRLSAETTRAGTRSASRSPRISIENPRGEVVAEVLPGDDVHDSGKPREYNDGGHGSDQTPEDNMHSTSSQEMNHLDPGPISDDDHQASGTLSERRSTQPLSLTALPTPDTSSPSPPSPPIFPSTPSLPPLPPQPTAPSPFDPTPYTDKDSRKLAEKDHARQVKSYQRAVKDRDSALKDRKKLLEKRAKNARLAREKTAKEDEKARAREEKEDVKRATKLHKAPPTATTSASAEGEPDHDGGAAAERAERSSSPGAAATRTPADAAGKKPRDRKFCVLPPKVNGVRDPRWARVFMVGVDEVGAHCGLFFADKPHYAGLVGDVAARVEGWLGERRER